MMDAKVMVVEDESIVALDIQNQLSSLGYIVSAVVGTGEEAVRVARREPPDLVLMDICLRGEMDGIRAAGIIRDELDLPVIYLTAYDDEATLRRARVTAPFGYLLKPFEERQLHTSIEMALYRHALERKVKESEQWLSTTLRSIGDGVLATDAQGCIAFMNTVAEELTGWQQREALGREAQDILRFTSPKEGVTGEVHSPNEVCLVTRRGKAVPVENNAAPIRDEQGRVVGVVFVFRDISERKRAEEVRKAYVMELRQRNEELDAFAHTVAHDLKNPLNLVTGFIELLRSEEVPVSAEDQARYLEVISHGARKIANIIDELLLLAETRKVEVEPEPIDMGEVVSEALQRLSHMIHHKKAEIVQPLEWPSVLGHGPWIEEVWANYISNAIKYGGSPPHVEIGYDLPPSAKVPHDCDLIRFWVRDNGKGLAPDKQAQLFTPFTQLSQVRATGHGLGLSIVRRIIEKLNGRVGVESEVGYGSRFYFSLPICNQVVGRQVSDLMYAFGDEGKVRFPEETDRR
jgi:PAS domain S-box-containing protein